MTMLWKLLTHLADVTEYTLGAASKSYDRHMEILPEDKVMTFKVLKYSLSFMLVAFSLLSFGAIVFG